MPPSPPPPSSAKAHRVLACVLCQHRKIKCDRNSPCSNCIKANVTCTPSTPAPARKRRRPNQDLQERLARCEELLKTYASGSTSGDTPPSATSSHREAVTPHDPLPSWISPGKVVVENGSTRFMGSPLWTKVYDELSAMRKIMDADEGPGDDMSALTSEPPSPDDTGDLLMGEYASMSLEDVRPDPVQIFRMWQIFSDRVNPLTKVIHVPTVQPHIIEAATGSGGVPPNYVALLFAIYNTAVMAMSEAECQNILGTTKDEAHKRFATGIRNALIHVQFMKQHDLVILQALSLYMVSLQGRYNRHALWIFSGVCVRIAQKMGLHRDGELLNLTPFETEMRRRIWWHLVHMDARCAMMSGVGYSLLPASYDTKLPRNLNDADLFPGSTEPVPERQGPTEMGFCLLYYVIGRFMIKFHAYPGFEAAILGETVDDGHANNPEAVEGLDLGSRQYQELLDSFEAEVREVEEKYLDATAGPSQYVAAQIPNLVLGRMRSFLVPMRDLPEYGTEVFGQADNMFRIGVCNLENNLELYKLLDSRGFQWQGRAHFSVDVFAVTAAGLARKPKGTLADRCWRVVDEMYRWHSELLDLSQRPNMTLAIFLLKAWKQRVQALAELGQKAEPGRVVVQLSKLVPAAYQTAAAAAAVASSSSAASSATPASSSTPGSGAKSEAVPGAHGCAGTAAAAAAAAAGKARAGNQQHDPVLEQFLGSGYIDMSMDWDMWGNLEGSGGEGPPPSGGAFSGMSGFGGPGAWQV